MTDKDAPQQEQGQVVTWQRAFEAADKYIDRLRTVTRGGQAPDLDECQRMFAHHKLQLHSRPLASPEQSAAGVDDTLSLVERDAIENMRSDYHGARKIMASDAAVALRVIDRLLRSPSPVNQQPINAQDPLLLLESLVQFGPSADGAVQNDLRHAIMRLQAMVAVNQQMEAWRPIESAPKDGEAVLLYKPDERRSGDYTAAGYWGDWPGRGGECWIAVSGGALSGHPTHWRPLPAPPVTAAAGAKEAMPSADRHKEAKS